MSRINVEFTKVNLLLEVNNDMCHNFYYIYYGKIYNEDKTRYRKFKYIECFDMFDVQECYEKEWITKEDIKNYALELTDNCYLYNIKNYNDIEGLKEFYKFCNDTIKDYNRII